MSVCVIFFFFFVCMCVTLNWSKLWPKCECNESVTVSNSVSKMTVIWYDAIWTSPKWSNDRLKLYERLNTVCIFLWWVLLENSPVSSEQTRKKKYLLDRRIEIHWLNRGKITKWVKLAHFYFFVSSYVILFVWMIENERIQG